jgi:hypothetical protein
MRSINLGAWSPEVLFFVEGGGGCTLIVPFASRSEQARRLVAPGFFSNIVEVCEALGLTFHLEKQRKPRAWALGF